MANPEEQAASPTGQPGETTPAGDAPRSPGPLGVSDDPVPGRIDEFEIGPILGGGGMGVVYKAFDHQLNRPVALKVMRTRLGADSALDLFRNEIRTLASLDHAAIAVVYRAGTFVEVPGSAVRSRGAQGGERSRERLFYAMQFLPGAVTITAYAAQRNLNRAQRVALFLPVADAMAYAHGRGVVHRDLKPGNILITPQGQPKVIDFGIALTTDAATSAIHHLREEGRQVGTSWYMSPEQFAGRSGAIEGSSDVYTLGVILYELLLGRLPHEVKGKPMREIERLIVGEAIADPQAVDPGLPEGLAVILRSCLQKDAGLRPSARELTQSLRLVAPTIGPGGRALDRPAARAVLAGVAAGLVGTFVAVPLLGPRSVAVGMQQARSVLSDVDTSVGAFGRTRLVAITPRTDLTALIAREKVAGHPADRVTRRALHARLLDRLARLDVRAVAWDVHFPEASEFDELLRRAAAVRFGRGEMVFAATEWTDAAFGRVGERSQPGGPGRRGGASFGVDPDTYAEVAVFRPDAAPMASLALAALGIVHWPERGESLALAGEALVLGPGEAGSALAEPPPLRVDLAAVFDETEQTLATGTRAGLRAGDRVGAFPITVPGDEVVAAATIDYQAVFEASDEQLRRWFDGRAVVIGDVTDASDRYRIPDGRTVAGCVLQLTATEALIAGYALRAAGAWWTLAAAVALGWAAAGGAVWTRNLYTAAGAGVVVLGAVAAGASLGLLYAGVWMNPVAGAVAAGLAPGLIFIMSRTRREPFTGYIPTSRTGGTA